MLAGTIILNVLSSGQLYVTKGVFTISHIEHAGLAELSWAHSTEEMLIGYMSAMDSTPKVDSHVHVFIVKLYFVQQHINFYVVNYL